MKRKIFSTLFALVLALSFSMVAVPAGAVGSVTHYVSPLELSVKNDATSAWSTAQVENGFQGSICKCIVGWAECCLTVAFFEYMALWGTPGGGTKCCN